MHKPQDVVNEDWRYLIILDACRYDRFALFYKKYFKGVLQERISPGRDTFEWLVNTWKEKYNDIIYISTVPFCNSKNRIVSQDSSFFGKEHFKKIYDLWDWGWNSERGTVFPQTVNLIAIKEILKYPRNRFVIHYVQPHAPYLTFKGDEKLNFANTIGGNQKKSKMSDAYRCFYLKIRKIINDERFWKIRKILKLNPQTKFEIAWRKVGKKGIERLYDENLLMVMKYVKKLILHLPPGKIIISADHGELLGERGFWGHGRFHSRIKELTHVPYLEIQR